MLTPFYSEDVLYTEVDLAKETEDGVSVLYAPLFHRVLAGTLFRFFVKVISSDDLSASVEKLFTTHRPSTRFGY